MDGSDLAKVRAFLRALCDDDVPQRLRHPLDAARYDDARAMLAACEDVLERGLP